MAAGAQAPVRPMAAVPNPPPDVEAVAVATMSPSLTHFAPAFVQVQMDLQPVVKNATNPHFENHFADLAAILAEAMPIITRHGFGLMQPPCTTPDGRLALLTMLIHKSGEFVSAVMPLYLAKNDPQGEGSAITYGRRYAACAILGIRTVDDDGNDGSNRSAPPPRHRQDRPQRGQREEAPPATDQPAAVEGWADKGAEAAAHKAVSEQIKQLKESLPADHADVVAMKAYIAEHGWPMAPDALAELSRTVAKATKPVPPAEPVAPSAHETAQTAQNAQTASEAPDAQPEPPTPQQRPQTAESGQGVRVLPDGSRIIPRTLCPYCEQALANGSTVTSKEVEGMGDKRRWHQECYDEYKGEPESGA